MNITIPKIKSLKGEITVPGDKSISHRCILFGAISNGLTEAFNFLQGADCLSTISCFQAMGIPIENKKDRVLIHGKGLLGLSAPENYLDVGNSGTTIRLISGILSAQSFETTITGDDSIQKRPMKRIIEPLTMMGADITSLHQNNCAPLCIQGKSLHGIHYISQVASAQVKSAILLAGLYADSPTSVDEPFISRNHSEIMLSSFGAKIERSNTCVTIHPSPVLEGQSIEVPGDISSAAYFIAAGLLVPNSELLIKNVGINPTRDGILQVVSQMGGDITLLNKRISGGEVIADILVSYSVLKGITIEGSIIPTLIDEIPIIAVMAAFADGTTIIRNAEELKVKESNRIEIVVNGLKSMGCDIAATDDGMIIRGGASLHGASIPSSHDHRIAMSFAIAGLNASGTTTIENADCVTISYPSFFETLKSL